MDTIILSRYLGNLNTPDDTFIRRLYNYHYKSGFRNIMTENIISLLINYFLIFFINFLTNCIKYRELVNLDSGEHKLSNFIDMHKWFPSNLYLIICFVLYIIYLLCLTINTITEIRVAWSIKKIYKEKLGITTNGIQVISWNNVVDKIRKAYPDPNLNVYTIASKIMRHDNIAISIYRSDLLKINKMSKFLEWNFTYCFINSLFNKKSDISEETLNNYKNRVKRRLKIVSIINILALPFAIYIVLIYSIIKYGEKFYHHPELVSKRMLTIKSRWRLRYYNELPHQFQRRINQCNNIMETLVNTKKNIVLNVVVRFIAFVLGSFFILLLILSIINDNILTDCYVFGSKNVLWTIGILGAILIIIRRSINSNNDFSPDKEEKLYKELSDNLASINPKWFRVDMRKRCMKLMNSIFQSKLMFILLEIWYLIMSPYYLYVWFYQIDNNHHKIIQLLEKHYILGYVSCKSIFTNVNIVTKESHSYASMKQFHINNPDWGDIMMWYQNLRQSSIVEEFDWNNIESPLLSNTQINEVLSSTILFNS